VTDIRTRPGARMSVPPAPAATTLPFIFGSLVTTIRA